MDPYSRGDQPGSIPHQLSGQVEADSRDEAEAKARALFKAEYGDAPAGLQVSVEAALGR